MNNTDKELDEILNLLNKSNSPVPSEVAKKSAISAATEKFNQKSKKSHQGIIRSYRLMDTVKAVFRTILEEGLFMKKKYILAASASLAALTVAIISFENLSVYNDIKSDESRVSPIMQESMEAKTALSSPQALSAATPAPMVGGSDGFAHDQNAQKKVSESLASTGGISAGQAAIAPAPTVSMEIAPYYPEPYQPQYYQEEGRDKFEHKNSNSVISTKENPLSTFSIDVDTASYSFVRASLNNNVMPQKDAVRVEEMINYFPYEYESPKDKSEPFKASVAIFPTPWNTDTKLMHIGIKGYQIEKNERPRSNLVFLIDTSGSMNAPNKLPLLKNSLKFLVDSLREDDTISIVTYAGSSGVALEPTKAKDKSKIFSALDNLYSGGATAGAAGIVKAYQIAEQNFDENGVNRIILATDGDFNVGTTNQEELKNLIERKRNSGIFLSVLGFGTGNYNDALMQTLAQNGNGNAAYIDNLSEARKVLVEESGSTLFPIAKDVKIQVEFNPEQVAEYRLIGYETRMLKREDFNNDKVDAGEIGAGHTVTAIYEITPIGSKAKMIDDSRYQKENLMPDKKAKDSEYAFIKIRYKLPDGDSSKLITTPVDNKVEFKKLEEAPSDVRFATSVAAFAQILRDSDYIKSFGYDDVISLAESAKGTDKFGYRSEFINLVRLSKNVSASNINTQEERRGIIPEPITETPVYIEPQALR